MMQQRIEWIDIAKGLGMLLVIAGHTVSLRYSYPLYAFHMPLFFFLSGLVFKDKNEGFWTFVKSRTNTLIKPWAVMLFISFMVCLAIPEWREQLALKPIIADFYTANTNTLQNSSLWYLVCFYFVLILFYFLNKVRRTHTIVCLFALLAIAILWIKNGLNILPLPYHRLPFKVDSSLVAIVFFAVAFWNKDLIFNFIAKNAKMLFIVLFVLFTIALCVANKWSNINSLDFGRIKLLYYPIALLGICTICLISQWLTSSNLLKVKEFLVFYGKNSLLIFGFQSLFIRLYLLFFNNVQGLNMELYGDNPWIHQIGSFVVVSFIISPLVVYIFLTLRKQNINVL